MIRRDIDVLQRRGTAPLAAAALTALLAVLAGCSAAPKPQASQSRTVTRSVSPAASHATALQRATPSVPSTPTPTPTLPPPKPSALPVDPGAGGKPQTAALPKTSNQAFRNVVHDIWLAVTTGDPKYALPAFFPEKAYEQVKAIAYPDSDWENRLWLDFTLDLAAVHKLVKPGARLTAVNVASQYFQWVPAGACYNNVGYWHAPGSRVVYREGGVTHSFGIASFISWRGDWYLIHFGAVVRDGAYGIVDDPELGPGVLGPPGNC